MNKIWGQFWNRIIIIAWWEHNDLFIHIDQTEGLSFGFHENTGAFSLCCREEYLEEPYNLGFVTLPKAVNSCTQIGKRMDRFLQKRNI